MLTSEHLQAKTGRTLRRGVAAFLPLLVFSLLAATSLPAESRVTSPAASYDENPLAEPRLESVGVGIIPRDVVPTMAQDKAGFLWIATGDGLVRYDGYRFRPQERDSPDPAARNLGWIRALLAGSDGRLWIGTEWDGLAVYDPTTEKVSSWRGKGEERDSQNGGPLPTIRALAEDRDGSIWAGSEGGGLDHFDLKSGSVSHYLHSSQPGSLPDDRVQALLIGRAGDLWVGTWAGLSRLKAGGERFEPVVSNGGRASLAGRIVEALFQASDGRIWVGTQQGDLAIVDPSTGKVLLLDFAEDIANHGAVSSLVEAPGGRMWVGRSTGIDLHDVAGGRLVQRLRHDLRKRWGLAGNEVTALIRDQAGLIWVGGFGVGLQRHDPNNRSIWLRGADPQPDSPFSEADVRSLLQLDNGEIWAATHKGGVAVMDKLLRVTGAIWPRTPGQINATGKSPKLPPVRVEAMAQAREGTVWLGSDSMLYQFSRDHRQLQTLPHGGGLTRRLLAGSDGTLWVATQDGVYFLRPDKGEVVRLSQADGQPLRADINALAEAADGSVWVGSGKGLFRVAAGGSELQPVESPAGAGLGNHSVIGLLFDSQQTLWLDTAVTGLHRMLRWDGRQAQFDRISESHGIVSRPFGGNLMEDGRGRIWTQMYVYDPATDRLDELTAADGANLGTGWFLSRAKTTDGRMLFGGSKGILVVSPERFDASTYAPPLLISELVINGQRESAGGILNELELTPEQRSFSLGFTAVDYCDPSRIRYAYQLKGFDPDWIETTADSRVASYSNLWPGEYLLRARATNRSGAWSPHQLAIPIRVLPSWWQSWWFHLAAPSLLILMVYALVQLRTRQLRLRQSELQRMVHERTVDLESLTLALKRESTALEESSLTDPLTGLRNRRFLTQHIEAEAALAVREYESHFKYGAKLRDDVGLIFFLFDIDFFKQVNDRHGHAAGDAVIRQMSDRLVGVFRDTDYLVRWGGEEFLVVARATPRNLAAALAERARGAVADQPFELDDGSLLSKTCSIGFCCFPLSRQHAGALGWDVAIKIADEALYVVKDAGRNGWLGALSASAESAEALCARSRLPLIEWARSGELDAVWSPDHGGLETAGLQRAPVCDQAQSEQE